MLNIIAKEFSVASLIGHFLLKSKPNIVSYIRVLPSGSVVLYNLL